MMKKTILAAGISIAIAGAAHAQSFGFGTFSAFVNSDGTTSIGSGVQASKRTSTGTYRITFTRDVGANCVFVASPRGAKGGQASISRNGIPANQIQVNTFTAKDAAANLSFSVIASCSSGS